MVESYNLLIIYNLAWSPKASAKDRPPYYTLKAHPDRRAGGRHLVQSSPVMTYQKKAWRRIKYDMI